MDEAKHHLNKGKSLAKVVLFVIPSPEIKRCYNLNHAPPRGVHFFGIVMWYQIQTPFG